MFGVILKSGATSIITAHNPPSGKLKPSNADYKLHNKVKEIAYFHEINYLDNLVITDTTYYSFMDQQTF